MATYLIKHQKEIKINFVVWDYEDGCRKEKNCCSWGTFMYNELLNIHDLIFTYLITKEKNRKYKLKKKKK